MKIFQNIRMRFAAILVALPMAAFITVGVCRPVQAACRILIVAKLPVTMVGKQPFIPAKINNIDETFFVHSSSTFSNISSAAATQLHLVKESIFNRYEVNGLGVGPISLTKVKNFSLAGQTLNDVDFIVGGGEVGKIAIGMIGQNILGYYDTDYDFGRGLINLIKADDCDHVDLTYWAKGEFYAVEAIERGNDNRFSITKVLVNDVPLRAMFNTGAATSILSINAAKKVGIYNTYPPSKEGALQQGSVKKFQIGEEKIFNTKMLVGDIGGGIDAYLGMDFFLSHHILVSNSQHKVFITYNGGPVFDLNTKAISQHLIADGALLRPAADEALQASSPSPTDADGFSRRGSAFAARLEYDSAVADFTRAAELAPNQPKYVYQRALVRLAEKQPALAMADLDTAIKLDPSYADALIARANQHRHEHDLASERGDLDAASIVLPKAAYLRLDLAELYSAADQYDRAVAEYSGWIDTHPDDGRRPSALNGRCFARALWNRDLDKALLDCNTSLWLMPGAANILDSRGLVRLRRGEFSRAISDYDAALKRNPKIAWSLYGRGLAELKTGEADKGRSDIAAAVAIAPDLPERAGKLGLSPEAFAPTSSVASTPTSPTVH